MVERHLLTVSLFLWISSLPGKKDASVSCSTETSRCCSAADRLVFTLKNEMCLLGLRSSDCIDPAPHRHLWSATSLLIPATSSVWHKTLYVKHAPNTRRRRNNTNHKCLLIIRSFYFLEERKEMHSEANQSYNCFKLHDWKNSSSNVMCNYVFHIISNLSNCIWKVYLWRSLAFFYWSKISAFIVLLKYKSIHGKMKLKFQQVSNFPAQNGGTSSSSTSNLLRLKTHLFRLHLGP